jgi:hypothetical protein
MTRHGRPPARAQAKREGKKKATRAPRTPRTYAYAEVLVERTREPMPSRALSHRRRSVSDPPAVGVSNQLRSAWRLAIPRFGTRGSLLLARPRARARACGFVDVVVVVVVELRTGAEARRGRGWACPVVRRAVPCPVLLCPALPCLALPCSAPPVLLTRPATRRYA